jgi:hypothetical protein
VYLFVQIYILNSLYSLKAAAEASACSYKRYEKEV